MGPNLFAEREGAVLEVAAGAALVERWEVLARLLLDRLHWTEERIVVRAHDGVAQCFVTAPIDGLMAATELNEQAWLAAESPESCDLDDVAARLRVAILHDRAPRLMALQREAGRRGLAFTFDDDDVSLGMGTGAATWSRTALPDTDEVPWDSLHDVPIALVTGSNGKTTTTRLVAAMLARAGHVVGLSSTDGVQVAGDIVTSGDYSGPSGARLVLRDRRVTAAVLETARGGMLRRGLAVGRSDVTVVTRVAADHFGEYGVTDLETLAEVKLMPARLVPPHGTVVLNADDPVLLRCSATLRSRVTWFSLDGEGAGVRAHLAAGGAAAFLAAGALVLARGEKWESLGMVAEMPSTLGGAARHNVANALAAAACAEALGVPLPAIRAVLASFGRVPSDNPGRLVALERDGVTVIVDYVHNPDGWEALHGALRHLPAARRIVVVGQAGDRDDDALRALARAVWDGAPSLVFLKELTGMLRGRLPGETSAVLAAAFDALGAPPEMIVQCPDERSAVSAALAQACPGDLVILGIHDDYRGTMEYLEREGVRPAIR